MTFQTQIPLEKQSKNLIDYNSNVLLLGSCFSNNIGDKLAYFKFQNLQNPFGILFQPKAIETLIYNSVNQKKYTEKDIFFHNEQWHCFDAHSKLSKTLKEDLISDLNKQIDLTFKRLNDSTHIIITLGSAWVYKFKNTSDYVANCHKLQQGQFEKCLLSISEIEQSLINCVDLIKKINQNATIIFTVSPVRHIKDGFIENTLSKSHLISAIHSIVNKSITNNQQPITNTYFPSYEIMMDELRDYRFYNEDMLHPNSTAINYIWEKFQYVWLNNQAVMVMNEVDAIQKGLNHKPFNANSEAHKRFISNVESKIEQLKNAYPFINF